MNDKWTIEDIIKGLEGMILSTKFIEHDFNGIVNIEACEQAIDLLKAQESSVPAVPLEKMCKILADNNDCPTEHNPVQDCCIGKSCTECWKSVLMEGMEDDYNS